MELHQVHANSGADAAGDLSRLASLATLTELELRILDFERQWWRYAGAKESSIKELFDLTPPAYYQLLNNLIDRDAALLSQPMLVKRLRRLREARTEARAAGFRL